MVLACRDGYVVVEELRKISLESLRTESVCDVHTQLYRASQQEQMAVLVYG
jgi:hypothetical protein